MIPQLRLAFVPALCSLVFLTGCGGGSRIEGTVTLDGQPVEDGTITFYPEGGKDQGPNVPGEIKDGKYSIDSSRHLKPGSYRVEIYWFKKTGKQIQNKNDPGTSIDETKQVIPDEYNRDSKTKAEIKSGSNTQNFELKSGGKITQGGAAGTGNSRPANDETQPNRR